MITKHKRQTSTKQSLDPRDNKSTFVYLVFNLLDWWHQESPANIIAWCSWLVGWLTKVKCPTALLAEKKHVFVNLSGWLANVQPVETQKNEYMGDTKQIGIVLACDLTTNNNGHIYIFTILNEYHCQDLGTCFF